MSRRRRPGQCGFTLMEIIIVLAIIAALAAIITPLAFSYLSDAKKTQAQNDANQVAEAIARFVRDTALPPYKNNTATDKSQAFVSTTDFDCLQGSVGGDPDVGTSGWACAVKDTIDNHMIINAPAGDATKKYKTTGKTAWKGPYLPNVPADPWGKRYLVNIGQANPSASPAKAVWVLSAGPDGKIDTAFDKDAATTFTASGDDIIARVK